MSQFTKLILAATFFSLINSPAKGIEIDNQTFCRLEILETESDKVYEILIQRDKIPLIRKTNKIVGINCRNE